MKLLMCYLRDIFEIDFQILGKYLAELEEKYNYNHY